MVSVPVWGIVVVMGPVMSFTNDVFDLRLNKKEFVFDHDGITGLDVKRPVILVPCEDFYYSISDSTCIDCCPNEYPTAFRLLNGDQVQQSFHIQEVEKVYGTIYCFLYPKDKTKIIIPTLKTNSSFQFKEMVEEGNLIITENFIRESCKILNFTKELSKEDIKELVDYDSLVSLFGGDFQMMIQSFEVEKDLEFTKFLRPLPPEFGILKEFPFPVITVYSPNVYEKIVTYLTHGYEVKIPNESLCRIITTEDLLIKDLSTNQDVKNRDDLVPTRTQFSMTTVERWFLKTFQT